MRTLHSVIACAALTLTLAACSSPQDDAGNSTEFADRLERAETEAREGGASEAQLAIIERAKQTGAVSVEDLRAAAHATVECITAQGVTAEYVEDTSKAGLIRPNYRAAVDDDVTAEQIIQLCDVSEFQWANYLYNFQDSAVEITEQYIEEKTPALRECLEAHGHPMDADASFHDLLQEADTLERESDGTINCFFEAGLDTA